MVAADTHILVVEDQRAVAGALRMRLRGLGYDVLDIAKDAAEAIEKAGDLKPDLILMDIRLGDGMDGIEAAQEIRSRFGIPVVYVTAYADSDILDRARATDPAGFINKPFTTKDLLTTIDFALHREGQPPAKAPEEMREAVITTDREGHISFISSGAEQLTGWARGNVIGNRLGTVLESLYGIAAADADARVQRVLDDGKEQLLKRKSHLGDNDGDLLTPLSDCDGTVYGVALRFDGVTVEAGFAALKRAADATRLVLDQLSFGVVVVDRQLRIATSNRRAREIVAASTELDDANGVLGCPDPELQQALVEAVSNVVDSDGQCDENAELLVFATEDDATAPTGVLVPVAASDGSTTESIALLLFEPAFRQQLSPSIMKKVYGLTRSEIRLVQTLVGGASLEDGAERLNISVNTARTHLKHIFNKTGARRQSELIHKLETGPSGLPVALRPTKR